MTRVASFSQSQMLLAELMRSQARIFESQQQVSSGKVADSFAGFGNDTSPLLAAKSVAGKVGEFSRVSTEVSRRLDIQNLHLDSLANDAGDLRAGVLDAVSTGKGVGMMERIEGAFRSAVNVLNSSFDGQRLYAGSRTDTPPVSISDFNDLVAAAAAGDIFQNDDVKARAFISENQELEYGLLASEVGQELMAAMKRIGDFNAGPGGPFGADLTQAQITFLEGELSALKTLQEDLNELVAINGLRYQETDRALAQHAAMETQLQIFISDIENVDLAEAISNLQQSQTTAEAATRVLGTLQRSSLLDFIR